MIKILTLIVLNMSGNLFGSNVIESKYSHDVVTIHGRCSGKYIGNGRMDFNISINGESPDNDLIIVSYLLISPENEIVKLLGKQFLLKNGEHHDEDVFLVREHLKSKVDNDMNNALPDKNIDNCILRIAVNYKCKGLLRNIILPEIHLDYKIYSGH